MKALNMNTMSFISIIESFECECSFISCSISNAIKADGINPVFV